MIELMLAILAAWFVSLFAGPAIYAAMGLAGFAFLAFAGDVASRQEGEEDPWDRPDDEHLEHLEWNNGEAEHARGSE